jgi:hypothetical protein
MVERHHENAVEPPHRQAPPARVERPAPQALVPAASAGDVCSRIVEKVNVPHIVVCGANGTVVGKLRAEQVVAGTLLRCMPQRRYLVIIDLKEFLIDRAAV